MPAPPPLGTAICGGFAALALPEISKRIRQTFSRNEQEEEEISNKPEPWGGAARLPDDEAARMKFLRELSVLDTNEHEAKFDDITQVVSGILGVPIVLISLVAERRQWFKSRTGLDASSTSRDTSFCAWTFLPKTPRMLIVPDARTDKRFAQNPLVIGDPFIRFYAGCPLVTSDGLRLGAFCLIDRVPRVIAPAQQQIVINFAELISRQVEKERLVQQQQDELEFGEGSGPTCKDFEGGTLRADRVRESLAEPLLLVSMNSEDPFWPILYANEEWYKLTKLPYKTMKTSNNHMNHMTGAQRHFLQCLEPMHVVGSAGLPDLFGSFIKDGVCFGLTCETKTPERIQFTCRCQPADRPLDAAAEAIQIVRDPDSGAIPDPDDPVYNRLYFVIMTKMKSPSAASLTSRPPSCNQSSSPVQRPTQGTSICSEAKKSFKSIGSSRTDDLSSENDILELPSTKAGKTLQSLNNIRPPTTPFSDVRLIRIIGKGSFAKVFYGLWIGQPVAVKVATWTKTNPGEARPIFEGALSQELSHPNLVQTFKHSSVLVCKANEDYNAGLMSSRSSEAVSTAEALSAGIGDQFETWITQEWCDMGTLMAHVESRPPMKCNGLADVVGICVDISSAMTYMHGRGIIHGDLTANNVLLTCKPICKKGYICKVSDFGLSRILEGDHESIMTQQLGTVTYMPPELFKTDGCKLTRAADVYAIGIMMWHVYTGTVPYKNLTPPQVIVQVAQGLGLSLPEDANPKYAKLYSRCTDRIPESRPNISVVLDELLDFLHLDIFKESKTNGQAEKVPEKKEKEGRKASQRPAPQPAKQPAVPQLVGQPAG